MITIINQELDEKKCSKSDEMYKETEKTVMVYNYNLSKLIIIISLTLMVHPNTASYCISLSVFISLIN